MTFWIKGWGWLFKNPKYLALIMAPWTLSLLLVGNLLYWFWGIAPFLSSRISYFFSYQPLADFSHWVVYILAVLFLLAWGMLLFYGFYLLLCPPFYSILVEKVLEKTGRKPSVQMTLKLWVATTAGMLRASIIKACVFGFLGLLVLALSWIPGLALLIPIFTAFVLAFDSMDYSFEVLGFSFLQRLNYFKANRDQFLKMFLSMGLTLLLPGLTFLALPGAVVGAALTVRTKKSED